MLQTADVLKLKCKFVKAWVKYLHNKKYVINYCYEDLYKYFGYFKQATTLIDCLEYEDECKLQQIANSLMDEPDDVITSDNCSDQATINLSYSTQTCFYTPSASIDDVAKLKYNLLNDSIYQNRTINLYLKNSCTNEKVLVSTYSDDVTYWKVGHTITFAKQMTGGYLKSWMLYKTDTNGAIIDSPILIDTSPTTTYLTGYATVVYTDLYFASANYATALSNVLKNAAFTLYGDADIIQPEINFDASGNLYFFTVVKHNPAGEWMGVNSNNGKHSYTYYNGFFPFEVNNLVTSITNTTAFNYNTTLDIPCGGTVDVNLSSNGALIFIWAGVSFNTIVANSGYYSTNPIFTTAETGSCTSYTLTADVVTTGTIVSKEWQFGEISPSTEYTFTTTETGDYTFEITLGSGCVLNENITVE